MADEPTQETPPAAQDEAGKQPTPPWGSEAEFNPEKAWNLIQGLRTDKDKIARERDDFKTKVDASDNENLSEVQRAAKERDDALKGKTESELELARLRAALKHGISEEDIDLLGSGTPDEIDARAKRLADRLGGKAQDPVPGKPKERLRGGSDPDIEPEETEPAKLAALIPRS